MLRVRFCGFRHISTSGFGVLAIPASFSQKTQLAAARATRRTATPITPSVKEFFYRLRL